MKTIAVVVNARLKSTRCPLKHIRKLADTTLIDECLKKINNLDGVEEKYLAAYDQELIEKLQKYKNVSLLEREKRSVEKGQIPFHVAFEHYSRVKSDYIMIFNPCQPFVKQETYQEAIDWFKNSLHVGAVSAIKKRNYYFFENGKIANFDKKSRLCSVSGPAMLSCSHTFMFFEKEFFTNNGTLWPNIFGNPYPYIISDEGLFMFDGYYNIKRFKYIHDEIINSDLYIHSGQERLSKTASFYSKYLNVYIDTSDGVNESLEIDEYCGRIIKIVEEACGKPFIYFKSAFSDNRSKNIVKIAKKNNGKVYSFFKWPYDYSGFFNYLMPNISDIRKRKKSSIKDLDIGFFGSPDGSKYDYPKPNLGNCLVSWSDYEKFGVGRHYPTGFYKNKSREDLYKKLDNSRFSIFQDSMSYKEYIKKSLRCKTIFNPPGVGEYTSRMFDQCFIGAPIVLRKNSYDQGHSWKEYLPEIDFEKEDWQNDYEKIIENHEKWGEKALYYYRTFWTPQAIVQYLDEKVKENL